MENLKNTIKPQKNFMQLNFKQNKSFLQVIFWFSFSLVFAAIYGIMVLRQAFQTEYVVPTDGRQHLFWMWRFLEPELFPNDLIANYFQSTAAYGYKIFYQLIAQIGIEPIFLSKILAVVLALVSTGYCFSICLQILPIPSAGFLSSLMLNHSFWIDGSLSSGSPRAFFYPLFLAFLFYFLRHSLIPCLITIFLMGLLYPPGILIMIGLLGIQLFSWKNRRLSFSRSQTVYKLIGAGVGLAVIMLLPYVWGTSEFGPTISLSEAKTLPEFLPEGRTYFFSDNFFDFWICGERSGMFPTEWCLLKVKPPQIFLSLLLPVLWLFRSRFPLFLLVSHKIFLLPQIIVASLGIYFTAHFLLFKLYLPSRYIQPSLVVVTSIAGGIAIIIILYGLLNWALNPKQISVKSSSLFWVVYTSLITIYWLVVDYPGGKKRYITLLALGTGIVVCSWLLDYYLIKSRSRAKPSLGKSFLAFCSSACLISIIIGYPKFVQLSQFPFPNTGYVTGKYPELYQFFERQPKDTLIASLEEEANNLPSFAKRSVLVGWKFALPYSTGYYKQIRERAIDQIEAQYSPDLKKLDNFIQKYGVDFWLLNQKSFDSNYINKNNIYGDRWLKQFSSTAKAVANLKQGTIPALAKVQEKCSVFKQEDLVVLDAKCTIQLAQNN